MLYQFVSEGCPQAQAGCAGCCQEIELPMKQAPSIGAYHKCPVKGCRRKLVRILSTGITGVVKGSIHDWQPGETMRMRMPDGRDFGFSFVDHKHTDPVYQRNLAQMAGAQNIGGNAHGLSNARYDEKLGRMVVDVASNVRDPLGTFERSKKSGSYQQDKIAVNQPYKRRGKGKR